MPTHEERRETRKLVANEVRAGASVGEAARRHGVSVTAARNACLEFGVALPGEGDGLKPQTLRIVAEIVKGKTYAEIAVKFGLTRQRVGAIKKQAEAAGLLEKQKRVRGPRPRTIEDRKKEEAALATEREKKQRERKKKLAERNAKVVKVYRETQDAGLAAKAGGIGVPMAYRVLKEAGVTGADARRISREAEIGVLADLLRGMAKNQIARERGVSIQAVNRVAREAKAAGEL